MEDRNIDKFYKLLKERKSEILTNLKRLSSDFSSLQKLEINDDGDFASISSDSYTTNILAKHQFEELKEIDYSMKKIETNREYYGICEMCQEEISEERLLAKPFARYCKGCRDIVDKNKKEG